MMSEFQHKSICTRSELHLEQRRFSTNKTFYRARCVGCGEHVALTTTQAKEWYQSGKVVQFKMNP